MPSTKCLKRSLAHMRDTSKKLPRCVRILTKKFCTAFQKVQYVSKASRSDIDSGYGGSESTLCGTPPCLPPLSFTESDDNGPFVPLSFYGVSHAPVHFSRYRGCETVPQFEPLRSNPNPYYRPYCEPETFDERAINTVPERRPQISYVPREVAVKESCVGVICNADSDSEGDEEQQIDPDLLLEARLAAAQEARRELEGEAIVNGMVDFSLSVLVNPDRLQTIGDVVERQPHLKIGSYRGRERRYTFCTGNLEYVPRYDNFDSSMSSIYCYRVK